MRAIVQNISPGYDLEHTAGATLNVMVSGQTTLSGRVLSTEREPIIGATASLDGHTAMTDAAGAFLLSGVTAGANRPLMIDGRTASSPNRTYPVIIEPANLIAGQANVNPYTFYLPPIDTQYEVEVVPGQNTVAGNPRVPGLQMTIPAGANLRNRDGSPITRVSITPLAIDRTPAPLPANIRTGLVYTSQPGGALSDIPMPVVYPNLLGTNPGTQMNLYAFNHDTVQWYIYGTGTVSSDGRTIGPDINPSTGQRYGLRDFSWHFPSPPPNAGQGGDGGGGGGGCDSCPCSRTGDPVDLSTGIKFETATDVSFGGARGGITLRREYSSDNSAQAIIGHFGRGWKDNYDIRLQGAWAAGGFGRVVMPDEQTGRLFNYDHTESAGALIFTTTATVGQLGDEVHKLTNGSLEYRQGAGEVIRFDAGGRLTSIIDQNGNTTTLTYAGSNLTQITDPVGRVVTLAYDSSNRVTTVTDPLNRSWHYTYDPSVAFGILSTVTDPMGGVTRYAYTNLRLSSITDPRGNFLKRITYDSSGRVITQQFADGGIERYDYTLSGGIVTETTITDPLGRKKTKRFNASGYVIGTIDALGQSAKIERGIDNNLPSSTAGPCGCAETTRTFDGHGNQTASTDRLGQTAVTEFEPQFNNVTKATDKLGRATNYSYDSRGNLTSIRDPLNETTTLVYDGFGQLTSITDALGHTSLIEYDANGNLTARIDALGNRTTFEYDAVGRLAATADPLGRRSEVTYDSLDRIVSSKETNGTLTTYDYDENGNQTRITHTLNRKWTKSYDSKNRRVSMVDPLGRLTRVQYDFDDQLTKAISASGRVLRYTYDERGQQETVTDVLGGVVRFAYDSRRNLTTVTDQRGNTLTFKYDELFRAVGMRDPLGKESTVDYDGEGNITSSLDRLGRRSDMTYDGLNRQSRITYADAVVNTSYDAAGRRTRIDDSQAGFVTWTYDAANRRLTEATPQGTVTYAYNFASQRISMSAADRTAVNYGYDSAGRLQSITQNAETFTYAYDTLSRVASLQRPNGVATSYFYDSVNHLARMVHASGMPLTSPEAPTPANAIEDFRYSYDQDDEISSITSLVSENTLPAPRDASAANASNRIAQFGSTTYTFDDQGQTTTKTDGQGMTTYTWDARGRMTGATLPNGEAVTYGYDALGRRANASLDPAGSTPSQSTTFLYDGANVVLDRNSDSSSVEYLNGPGIDNKLRQKSASTGSLHFMSDHLGSTIALTSETGGVIERQQYEPFGQTSSSQLTRYGFTGRERDNATGLMYYRARWYDPQIGRFMSEDPIGLEGGQNFYAYVQDNPVNLVDPFGLAYTKAQCAALFESIISRATRLAYKLGKYDPVADFSGGAHYNDARSVTKPFSHYDAITSGQKKLIKDIGRYIGNCLKRKPKDCDKDDPPPPGVPEWVEDVVTRPVERPHPGPSEMENVLRQGARWIADHPTEAVLGTIVVIAGVALIVTTGPAGALVFALAP
jgi:RHS repeat-associated protein